MLHLPPLTIDHKTRLDYHEQMTQIDTDNTPIRITGTPALDDNYIWMITQGKATVAIDPGESLPVIDWLKTQQRDLNAILITHAHHDHIGGVEALLTQFPSCQVYAHTHTRLPFPFVPHAIGDALTIETLNFSLLDLSGHTPDQVGYYLTSAKALFCGDALFAGGCGRLFNGGTPEQMSASLVRIAALASDTRIYCAHEYTLANLRFAQIAEPDNTAIRERLANAITLRQQSLSTVPSLLSDELATNPFLRTETPLLHQTIDAHAGIETNNRIERFRLLRAWKDQLDSTGILEVSS